MFANAKDEFALILFGTDGKPTEPFIIYMYHFK
jgi:hypothetical protein